MQEDYPSIGVAIAWAKTGIGINLDFFGVPGIGVEDMRM